MTPFHLAFPVRDLDETRAFYEGVLGCAIGRSSEAWVDFDLFGHQMSAHVRPAAQADGLGKVDGKAVPIPHFGVVLLMEDWRKLADRLAGPTQRGLDRTADDPLCRRARRAGDPVHPRPFRQRAGIQGFPLASTAIRALSQRGRSSTAKLSRMTRSPGDAQVATFTTGSTMRHVIVMTGDRLDRT